MICPTERLWVTYVAIAIHILLMMLVNAVLSKYGKSNNKDAAKCSFWDFFDWDFKYTVTQYIHLDFYI